MRYYWNWRETTPNSVAHLLGKFVNTPLGVMMLADKEGWSFPLAGFPVFGVSDQGFERGEVSWIKEINKEAS